jgi:general secretion pathway protein G
LAEVAVVLAIIATLSAISLPHLVRVLKQTQQDAAANDLRTIELLILDYQLETGALPDSLDQLGSKVPLDPWGNPYQYLRIAGAGNKGKGHRRKDRFLVPINSDFDLYSMGKDGKSSPPLTAEPSQDDIIRANDGSYVGLASEY